MTADKARRHELLRVLSDIKDSACAGLSYANFSIRLSSNVIESLRRLGYTVKVETDESPGWFYTIRSFRTIVSWG